MGEEPSPGKEAEQSFYKNLSLLVQFYDITPIETRHFAYPYNVALALWDVRRKLDQNRKETIRLFQKKEQNGVYFVTEEAYRTNTTLYYIPVVPLYQLLRDSKRKFQGQLLLCVFAYLYHVVDIPYYRHEGSYLFLIYDMIYEWVICNPGDWNADEYIQCRRQLETAGCVGDIMEKKIRNKILLDQFGRQLDQFVVRNEKDRACYKIAKEAYDLYREYPDTTIFKHGHGNRETNEDEYDTISLDKYIAFVAHTGEKWLFETLSQCVNDDFNECLEQEEPTITRVFRDTLPDGSDSLDFECRLFPLISELCYYLNNY